MSERSDRDILVVSTTSGKIRGRHVPCYPLTHAIGDVARPRMLPWCHPGVSTVSWPGSVIKRRQSLYEVKSQFLDGVEGPRRSDAGRR